MSVTRVLEALARHISPDTPPGTGIEAALRRAMESFSAHRPESIDSIRQIQGQDPSEFVMAAARVLASPDICKSAGAEFVAGFINNSNSVVDPLLDERIPPELALALTHGLAEAEPLWDARLMRKMLENAEGTAAAIPREVALRVLWLLDKVSDCSRVTPYLMQLARHPGSEVRSKSALLLGRGNLNMGRVKQFLGSEDGRTRANAVESLWGLNSPQARDLFREAATDPNRRVAVNALVGLCKAGDRTAHSKLMTLAGSEDPFSRRAAAWAMGQVGDPEFTATLEALAKDGDKVVRTMATGSLDRVQFAVASRPAPGPKQSKPATHPEPATHPGVAFTPSEPVEAGTVRDLRSYPLASSSRPAH